VTVSPSRGVVANAKRSGVLLATSDIKRCLKRYIARQLVRQLESLPRTA
jgi:hypothetical protein